LERSQKKLSFLAELGGLNPLNKKFILYGAKVRFACPIESFLTHLVGFLAVTAFQKFQIFDLGKVSFLAWLISLAKLLSKREWSETYKRIAGG